MSLQTVPSLDVAVKWTDELRIYGDGFVRRQEELAALDPIDTLYGCLKELPRDPLADLEGEHQGEIEADERWLRRGR